jgi:hypothetical protein
MKSSNGENNYREIWRKNYEIGCPTILVTNKGKIGISVDGKLIIAPVEKWHLWQGHESVREKEIKRLREALDRFSSFILKECDEWPLAHDAARIAQAALKQTEGDER